MDLSTPLPADDLARTDWPRASFADSARPLDSAVSWGAVAAGAAAAASLSVILLILGVGLGLSSVSPWARAGVVAASSGVATILWLTLTQMPASALGGYPAGRLRTKWTGVHTDEVHFCDTGHGFRAWAVASLATAALLTSAIGSLLGGGVQAGASVVGGVAATAGSAVGGAAATSLTSPGSDGGPLGYSVNSPFRRHADAPVAGNVGSPSGTDAAEVARIFMNVGRSEPLPRDDLRHVAQIVAQRTGLSQADAEKRVVDVHA